MYDSLPVCVPPMCIQSHVSHFMCISPMCIPSRVSHFVYPTPCMTHSVCVCPQCVSHAVYPILCISLFVYSTPSVFHSVCVLLRVCSTPYEFHSVSTLLHSVCVPLRVCPSLRVYPTPFMSHSMCIPLLCVRLYVSDSVYVPLPVSFNPWLSPILLSPTSCKYPTSYFHSVCVSDSIFHSLCVPLRMFPLCVYSLRVSFPVSSPPHLSHIPCPTPCASYSLFTSVRFPTYRVFLTPCMFHSRTHHLGW